MRKTTKNEDRLRYWVANPGSLLWMSEDRPFPNHDCVGVDTFKYGLNGSIPAYSTADYNEIGREGIVDRYFARNVDYAWGLADNGPGDTRCQAVVSAHFTSVSSRRAGQLTVSIDPRS